MAEAYLNYYITATEAGIELLDAVLKIGTAVKGQYFQKDFFYRLVMQNLKGVVYYVITRAIDSSL